MILKPFLKINSIFEVTPEILHSHDIKGLILDVDNTLSVHHGANPAQGISEWLDKMRNSGISLIILSNSKERRVKPFAKQLNLDYISLAMKPLVFGYFKASAAMGLKRKNTAIIGDQLFTDALGGNLSGVKTIVLDPIEQEKILSFRIRRKLERLFFRMYKLGK